VRWLLVTLLGVSACVTTGATGPKLTEREEAHLALQRGEGGKVVEQVDRMFAQHPDDLQLARMVADAHVQAHTADALLAQLATKDTAISHYLRGVVRFTRAAEAGGPAIDEFRRALELAPDEPEYAYRLGLALVETEQYEAALPPLRSATSRAPTRTSWCLPLAKALARTGDQKGAVDALRTVITGTPSAAEVKLARALMDQVVDPFSGVPQAARARLEQALQWLEVGDVPQQAIVALEELLQEFPDQAIVHSLLGLSYARLDDAGRAVDELQRAIELAPEDGRNHLYLANLYLARQRAKSGLEHLQRAVDLNPMLDEAWLKLGDVSLERQDYVSARQQFTVATRLDPTSISAHGKLALVHQLEKNWPAADRELHLVLDKDEENLEFQLRLGVLHTERFVAARGAAEREEAAKEATRWLEKVLAAQPENALASRALERIKAPR
jgi:tetratricopeptide (TPR) repeat protein